MVQINTGNYGASYCVRSRHRAGGKIPEVEKEYQGKEVYVAITKQILLLSSLLLHCSSVLGFIVEETAPFFFKNFILY